MVTFKKYSKPKITVKKIKVEFFFDHKNSIDVFGDLLNPPTVLATCNGDPGNCCH